MIRNLTLEEGRGCREHRHDWREGQEHVVKVARVANVLRLVGHLQAGTAHSKVHGVHVDLSCMGFVLARRRVVGVFVLKAGHLNIHLLLASFVDGLGQAEEARVWTSSLLRNESLMGVFVDRGKILAICLV